ncbi:MAG TPA: hypothetical protein DCK76_01960 [Desulfotomaculum sp.]|nr:MAG: Fimbrial protein PilA [Desulfotomaculum sp. 46_296]HAG10165.1 hypothetical protein [Desulfotomaculum sp.]HBY04994.1 hypothetical protein [Desulfotomaculum sp.]
MLKILRKEKGFTMIEMMVVLVIIAVLVGAGIKFYTGYIGKSRIDKAKADISTMQAAVESYYAENGQYIGDTNGGDLATIGLSTDMVGIPGTTGATAGKTYVYDQVDTSSYKIYTVASYGGLYVEGTGANGTSEKAGTVTSP